MTDQHEFAGKTIEEALELAAAELAAKAESIEYKLLETPKRFFFMGGSKEYRIRVLKYTPAAGGSAPVETPPPPRASQPSRQDRPAQPARQDRPAQPARQDRPAQPARQDRPAQPARQEKRSQPAREEKPARPARQERPSQPARPVQPAAKTAPEPPWPPARETRPEQPVHREEAGARASDDEELDRILDLVDDFIDSWGMNLEMEVNTTDERLEINFFGEDQQYLLEKKGAGLLSLQLILGKMLYKRGLIRRKLQVDCQGYRLRRENELREIANRTADRVKKNGEDAFLNPMNPYERRIVHLALVDDQQVTTDSLGDGYMKKIRIIRL